MENDIKYDSTNDTNAHKAYVNQNMQILIKELGDRAMKHDLSKLQSPEKETYDEYIPLLKNAKYGSPEHKKLVAEMAEKGTKHHYEANRHHPEHFNNDFTKMNLVDIVEMLTDWYSASLRSDTGFKKGFDFNCQKFNITEPLKSILWNTYLDFFNKTAKSE